MVLTRLTTGRRGTRGIRLGARGSALVAVLTLEACGDLTSANLQRPMFAFSAQLTEGTSWPAMARPLVGIVWSDPLQRQPDVAMPQSWLEPQWDAPPLGTSVEIRLFRPPPPEALAEIEIDDAERARDVARLAVGDVVVVDDGDGDGRFAIQGPLATLASNQQAPEHPDVYIAAASAMLLYVERPFASPHTGSPLWPATRPGYQLVNYDCAGRVLVGSKLVADTNLSIDVSAALPEHRNCLRTHRP